MKITKTQKGITLLALVITIVVLLILAGVAINSITSTNLIDQASAAGQKWNEAQDNESTTLGSYESDLDKLLPVTFTIDGVQYTAKYGDTWWRWANRTGKAFCTRGMVVTEFISNNGNGYEGTGRYVVNADPGGKIVRGQAYETNEFDS